MLCGDDDVEPIVRRHEDATDMEVTLEDLRRNFDVARASGLSEKTSG